jgi:hypothetical protein
MGKVCAICGTMTMFYTWSTSRYFDINKYLVIKGIVGKQAIKEFKTNGHPICLHCMEKHKLMNHTFKDNTTELPVWYKCK